MEVLMTFEPDPADLALSSIPGHETFDPRRHRFSEEELKPQPIMKKARKIQVPEEQKVSHPQSPPGSSWPVAAQHREAGAGAARSFHCHLERRLCAGFLLSVAKDRLP